MSFEGAPAPPVVDDNEMKNAPGYQRLCNLLEHMTAEDAVRCRELSEHIREALVGRPNMKQMLELAMGAVEYEIDVARTLWDDDLERRNEIEKKREEKKKKRLKVLAQTRAQAAAREQVAVKENAAAAQARKLEQSEQPEIGWARELKRKALESDLPFNAKKPKWELEEGDWSCAKCGWWNRRINTRCGKLHKGKNCDGLRDHEYLDHTYQKAGPGIKFGKSSAPFRGSWKCGTCWCWNTRRGGDEVKVKIAQDFSEKLEPPKEPADDPAGFEDPSRSYWMGPWNPNSGSNFTPSMQRGVTMAKYHGTFGRKTHSWEQKG